MENYIKINGAHIRNFHEFTETHKLGQIALQRFHVLEKGNKSMPRCLRTHTFLAFLMTFLMAFVLAYPAGAAVGIYKWKATSDSGNNTASIQYFLNVDATSGTVEILPAGTSAPIKTITLSGDQLKKGVLHQINWDGSKDSGGSAPTGDYDVKIKVAAAPVTQPTTVWALPTGTYLGIAVDNNENNPDSFGRIYVGRTSDHNLVIYEPDGSVAKASDGSDLIIKTSFIGASSPWGGIAVGSQGRVYSGDRSKRRVGNFNPLDSNDQYLTDEGGSVGYLQGDNSALAISTTGGVSKDIAYYYATGSSSSGSNAFYRIPINEDKTFGTATPLMDPGPAAGKWAVGCTFGWKANGESSIYLAWGDNAGAGGSVEKWNSTAVDSTLTWEQEIFYSGTVGTWGRLNGITGYPFNNELAVFYGAAPQIGLLDSDGNQVTVNGNAVAYTIPSELGTSIAGGNFDVYGNVAVVSGTGAVTGKQTTGGMIALPDADQTNGSSATRLAGTVHHVLSHFAPVMQSGSFDKTEIPADGTTEVNFSGVVADSDPNDSITGTIDTFGQTVNLVVSPGSDSNHWNIQASHLKCPVGFKAGNFVAKVSLMDSFALTNAEIVSPAQSASILVQGATLTGKVMLDLDDTNRTDIHNAVTIHAQDINSSDKTYSALTAADGTFTLAVNAGTFKVYADASSGYKVGKILDNVVTELGKTVDNLNPGVTPLSVKEAKALPDGAPFAVKGVCDGARYNAGSSVNGFTDEFYIRDAQPVNGVQEGIRVDPDPSDTVNYPTEGQTVVIEGSVNFPMGAIRSITPILSLNILANPAKSDYGSPAACLITDFNGNLSPDPGWGNLYQVSGVTVKAINDASVYSPKNIIVTDDKSNEGVIDIQDNIGVDPTTLCKVGDIISVTGIKDRQKGVWTPSCLRIRKAADVVAGQVQSSSTSGGFIKPGVWNLISLPTDPQNGDPKTILAGIDVDSASLQYWDYSGATPGFQSYGTTFNWTGPMVRGNAYWFVEPKETNTKDLSYTGFLPSDSAFELAIPAHSNAPYWVSLGTPFPSDIDVANLRFKDIALRGDNWLTWSDAYSQADASKRVVDSSMQGWDSAQGQFVRVAPSTTLAKLQPWWGYWILVFDGNEVKIQFPKP